MSSDHKHNYQNCCLFFVILWKKCKNRHKIQIDTFYKPNPPSRQIEITDEELGPHLTKDELQIADARGQSALHLAVQYCCKNVIIKYVEPSSS